jgi:hypothetical protein
LKEVLSIVDDAPTNNATPPSPTSKTTTEPPPAVADQAPAKRSLEAVYADLDALVGLQLVKQLIKQIMARKKHKRPCKHVANTWCLAST